ncbi:MAG: glutathione peroxidase [Eubacteriales bacterium]|nr:glutathione peroxidase [Eubacteriales bacterium]
MAKSVKHRYVSNRTTYKTVKKYDHQQFDEFCSRIYESGYQDGMKHPQEEMKKAVDMEKVLEAISTVKGVGPATMGRIRTAVDDLLTRKAESVANGGSEA